MTSSRIVEQDGQRFVEIVEPGYGGVKRYLVRGTELRSEVDFTGEPTSRRMPKRAPVVPSSLGPNADGWVVGDVAAE